MCAIVGSFDKDTLIKLIELNSYRGSHSYSFSSISNGILTVHKKEFGKIDPSIISLEKGSYGIVHVQAPTTEAKQLNSIHPAEEENTRLWHNGIIKADHVKKMQARFGNDTSWDTELLLRAINTSKDELNDVDGSFSCLWSDGAGAYLFRNDISPMFYDDKLNISSTRFEGSWPTPANKILSMNFSRMQLNTIGEFRTVENPYYFGDE